MTHLDLCSGIGGFSLAAQWAGFKTVGFSEIDPYCCALLAEKWPGIRNYGDLRYADFSEFKEKITILSAGVPCQPASLAAAGKRRGEDDDRWLWDSVCGVIGVLRPVWAILENPPGVLSLDEFEGILLSLEKEGYEIGIFQVPANAVGAKHRRQRAFIVAQSQCQRYNWRPDEWGAEIGARASAQSTGAGGDAEALADTAPRSFRPGIPWGNAPWRLTEPPLCSRADGVRGRVHQLKALGNAVVPQQAYPFFEAIAQIERAA